MVSISQQSYGARLQRAQDIFSYISSFANYNPPRPKESLANFQALLNDIVAANDNTVSVELDYNTVINTRQDTFKNDPDAILKLFSSIRAAVQAQYGKDSQQYQLIKGIEI